MLSEGAGVDASEDHLFGTAVGDAAGHAEGFFNGGRARAATGVRYGAVGAEVVAAVLYLEENTCAVLAGVGEEALAVVPQHLGDTWQLADFLGGHLCEATHDHYLGVGVEAVGLAYGGAAFLFGYGSDGAGVDEVEVGPLAPGDDSVAFGGEAAQGVGGLGEVEFAAEGVGGDGHFLEKILPNKKNVVSLQYDFWDFLMVFP